MLTSVSTTPTRVSWLKGLSNEKSAKAESGNTIFHKTGTKVPDSGMCGAPKALMWVKE